MFIPSFGKMLRVHQTLIYHFTFVLNSWMTCFLSQFGINIFIPELTPNSFRSFAC